MIQFISLHKKFCLVIIFLSLRDLFFAQYQPDYYVTLNNDTIRTPVQLSGSVYVTNAKVRVKINDKKKVFEPQELQAIYCVGTHYEPFFVGGFWSFFRREFSGDVSVYTRETTYFVEYYFRQKLQPRGQIKPLTVKEMGEVSNYYCQPIMDSLLNQKYNLEVFLPDLIKQYNDRCPEFDGAK